MIFSEEKIECIYANEEFNTRVCKLKCLPVNIEKCKKCKERIQNDK